jgi:hypothetical protein
VAQARIMMARDASGGASACTGVSICRTADRTQNTNTHIVHTVYCDDSITYLRCSVVMPCFGSLSVNQTHPRTS